MAQGLTRYRCFLPDLTEFAVPPCTGPNYQQSTSLLSTELLPTRLRSLLKSLCSIKIRLNGGEGGIRTLGAGLTAHTISSRAPSTARSPLLYAISGIYRFCLSPQSTDVPKCLHSTILRCFPSRFDNLSQGFPTTGKSKFHFYHYRDSCAQKVFFARVTKRYPRCLQLITSTTTAKGFPMTNGARW